MAGSHRSPGLRDEWRASQKPRDNSARVHDRFTEHERGGNRHRGKRRPSGPVLPRTGPPSRREDSVGYRESSPRPSLASRELDSNHRRPSFSSSQSLAANRDTSGSQEANSKLPENSQIGGNAVVENFLQRKRSRSPHPPRRERYRKNRNTGPHGRGQPNQRGKPSKRERYQERIPKGHYFDTKGADKARSRPNTGESQIYQNLQPPLSPRRRDFQSAPSSRRSLSPGSAYEDRIDRDQSLHSFESRHSRASFSTSPHREGGMNLHGHTAEATAESQNFPISPSHSRLDNSYHNSLEPNSPRSSGRKSRNNQGRNPAQNRSHSPESTENNYVSEGFPQGPYHQSQSHNSGNMSSAYASTQRGGYHRENHEDHRFSGHNHSGFDGPDSRQSKSHFNSHQWVESGPKGQEEPQDSPNFHSHSGSNTPQYQRPLSHDEQLSDTHQDDISKFPHDLHMEDSHSKHDSEGGDTRNMPPPPREPTASTTPAKEGGKFSFAFKSKANPPPATKPVPDLAQRMLIREPPRGPAMSSRAPEQSSRGRLSGPPPPKYKQQDYRMDRRDRDRDLHRSRGREDRRDFHPRNPRDLKREDHRFESRDARRRDDHRSDFRNERPRDRSPEPKRQKRIIRRLKPRPILPGEFRDSDSVYYRKPGDESVIGAGTYGKVFKAIHIYTQDKVALKRIRMEGEKDGFPVTAVREIKLLQHLRHENIVSLLEVMVEKNECFMVFEYLSHDLTGLINHPTFTLSEPHKKDLAKQMFDGLRYLHHRGVLHRDIKAANILISNRGQLKYADFGLARFFSKSRQLDYTNRVITIWYRPPELLLGDTRYGPAVDIWSAACVFMEMFTKKALFPGDGKELSQLEKLYSTLGTPTRAEWPGIVDMPWVDLMGPTERKKRVFEETYKDFISPGALDLICQMFQYDPAKRPTADEVLAHPYFTVEEPSPQQATELENIEGDWHEFESKALRKEKDREARKDREKEKEREKEKRRASTGPPQEAERDTKRQRHEGSSSVQDHE